MKKLIALLLAAMLAISLAACSGGSANSAEKTTVKNEINIPINDDCPSLLGWRISDTNQCKVASPIYEYLINQDESGNLVPFLLESYEGDKDAMTYVLHVREGITFQDGTPLNAEAVAWNLNKYWTDGIYSGDFFTNFESITATDDMTVLIQLNKWDNSVPYYLSRECGAMSSMEAYNKLGEEEYSKCPIGTGPFMVEKWVKGEGVYLVRYENYWQGTPKIERVNYKLYATDAVAQVALEQGDLDLMFLTGSGDIADSLAEKGFNVTTSALPETAYTLFYSSELPTSDNPLHDIRVRQAISYALDTDTINNRLMSNSKYGKSSNQWALEDNSMYNPEVVGYEYNLEKAKSLMAEAGYADGFTTTITFENSMFNKNTCSIIAEQLAQIGITAELNAMEVGNYASCFGGWEGMLFHPMWITCGQYEQLGAWFVHGTSFGTNSLLLTDTTDELVAEAKMADAEESAKDYKEVAKVLFDEQCQMKTISMALTVVAVNPALKDLNYAATAGHFATWHTAYFEG